MMFARKQFTSTLVSYVAISSVATQYAFGYCSGTEDSFSRHRHQRSATSSRSVFHSSSSDNNSNISLDAVADKLKRGQFHKILVVTGAGVSVSAGIPDFRTPGSGLYDNLERYNLPYPEAVFDLDFYRERPQPFVSLAQEIWPGIKYKPTYSHCFLKLLEEKGCLLRVYTQNIDGLDVVAGVSSDKMVECHGHFRTASCIQCGSPFDDELCKMIILEQHVAPKCTYCGGLVKPDIVFFGEELPTRYANLIGNDLKNCDLLIVMGTSLLVAPVAYIPELVGDDCPRVLLNREPVGDFGTRKYDIFEPGEVDASVRRLCRLLGWEQELEEIYRGFHEQ